MSRARVAAADLVAEFVSGAAAVERAEEERRNRGVTFREVAHAYLEWLEHVRGAKPSTIRSTGVEHSSEPLLGRGSRR